MYIALYSIYSTLHVHIALYTLPYMYIALYTLPYMYIALYTLPYTAYMYSDIIMLYYNKRPYNNLTINKTVSFSIP